MVGFLNDKVGSARRVGTGSLTSGALATGVSVLALALTSAGAQAQDCQLATADEAALATCIAAIDAGTADGIVSAAPAGSVIDLSAPVAPGNPVAFGISGEPFKLRNDDAFDGPVLSLAGGHLVGDADHRALQGPAHGRPRAP